MAHLEVEENCQQAEEYSHGGETKYKEGSSPNPLNHQTLKMRHEQKIRSYLLITNVKSKARQFQMLKDR